MTNPFTGIEYSSHDITIVKKLEMQIIAKRLQDNLDQILDSKKLKTYCKIMDDEDV